MPGAQWRTFRLGNRAELLVEQLLAAFAFTTRVPRQEDVGIDFFCGLISRDGDLLKSGPLFTVQAKSSAEPLVCDRPHEIEWITNRDNPHLICVADRNALAMDVYSTWNVMCGPLAAGQQRITLLPGVAASAWPGVVHSADGSQQIQLGAPIVRITDRDIFDEARVDQIATVIREWVTLDRNNIANRLAAIYWVIGPLQYETGTPLSASGQAATAVYWHPDNLARCARNLARTAGAIALIIRDQVPGSDTEQIWIARRAALLEVLRTHWALIDEGTRSFLSAQGMGP